MIVIPYVHSIEVTTCYLSIGDTRGSMKARIVGILRSQMIRLHPLSHDLLSVNRIYQVVTCSVKNNGWHNTNCPTQRRYKQIAPAVLDQDLPGVTR
jgi:hypothetical protein